MLKPILSALFLISIFPSPAIRTDKKFIYSPGTKAGGNYTPGILMDGTLYVSGQLGLDANGKLPADFEGEVKQSLDNIGAVLKEAGMSPADVVSVQVYLPMVNYFNE